MAISSTQQCSVTVTAAQYGKIASGFYTLPTDVAIVSATPDGTGANVTIVFCGTGLGSWAVQVPTPALIGDVAKVILLQPLSGSSSSSGL